MSKGDVAGNAGDTSMGTIDWNAVKPKFVGEEDSMSPEDVAVAWSKIYKSVGARDESQRLAVRSAVYHYALKNGTSRAGAYQADITTSYGKKFSASVIPNSTGMTEIRRFFRGNMLEAYDCLKASDLNELAPRVVAQCARAGISAANAFATGDWFKGCSRMTPTEVEAFENSQTFAFKRAANARGGTLESVEHKRQDQILEAQQTTGDW